MIIFSAIRCTLMYPLSWIRYIFASIFFHLTVELTKFGIVLLLAYGIALAIFHLWAQIIPDIPTTQRLSAAAAAVAAGPSRLSGQAATKASYPFVVEIPVKDGKKEEQPADTKRDTAVEADTKKEPEVEAEVVPVAKEVDVKEEPVVEQETKVKEQGGAETDEEVEITK